MIRVLHTIGEMGTGGAESLVAELVRRGPDAGWHSEVASAGGHRQDELVRDTGVAVHHVPLSRRRVGGLARAVRSTRRAIVASRPDVVIAHNVGVTAATWAALRTVRNPPALVTIFHGVAAQDYRASARLLSRASGTVVTVSSAIRRRLLDAGLSGRDPLVIPNAVTAMRLPDREQSRRELDLGAGERLGDGTAALPVALCAARMVDQKRHDVLLRAWARLPHPAVLLLAGDGPNRPQVEALVDELGLQDRVRVLGSRTDMPRLLAASDVFTLSSDWEGLPVAVLEAMSAGLAVVATAVDGVAEVLGDGGGLLVPPGDDGALAVALATLLDDLPAAQEAGRRAAEVIATSYDPATMMRSYDRLLRSLIGRPQRDPRTHDETSRR